MRIIMLGPPGSGKGTRARIISKQYNIPVISTGDLLREEAQKTTPEGKELREIMQKGELVPTEKVVQLVKNRLNEDDAQGGYILDGFPRNKEQAQQLEAILAERGEQLDYALYIEIEDEVLIDRLSTRRSCPECGAVYNLISNPPRKQGVCDECQSTLIRRKDDNPDVIRNRIKVFLDQTEPILEIYRNKNIIKTLSGDTSIKGLPHEIQLILG